jgi:F-type H+/Na+-transporting ATPase subunit alpha
LKNKLPFFITLTKGFLDDIPVSDITRFEDEFNAYLDQNNKALLEEIRTTGGLPKDEDIQAAIQGFKKTFAVSE